MSKVTTIGDVCSRFSSGKNIVATKIKECGRYPVYGGNGLRGYTDTYNFEGECAIIGRQGAYCGNVRYFSGKAYMTEHAIVGCAKPEHNTGYLAYKLSLMNLSQYQGQSAQPGLSVNTLSKVSINMPELDKQIKVFELLRMLDDKIENNNKINTELEAMAKAIYDYWFLQFEFPNEEGKPYKSSGGKMVWNEELKREIPEGWEVKKIGDVLAKVPLSMKLKTENYLKKGKYPIVDQSSEYICGWSDEEAAVINIDDAIIFGDHTKAVKYVNFPFIRGADGTQVILSNNECLPNLLLFQQIKNMNLVSQGYSRYYKFLKDKFVIIPSKQVANNYLKQVNRFYDKTKEIIIENRELESLREFLLPLLMNGQVGFNDMVK